MKSININGTEYVQKKELDELKESINKKYIRKSELKKIKSKILEINDLIEVEDVKSKKTATKKDIKSVGGRPTDDTVFTPSESLKKQDFRLVGVTKDGHFVKTTGHTTPFTVQDVRVLKQYLTNKTTYGQMRKFAKILGITPKDCRLVAYNITKGTFDKFI